MAELETGQVEFDDPTFRRTGCEWCGIVNGHLPSCGKESKLTLVPPYPQKWTSQWAEQLEICKAQIEAGDYAAASEWLSAAIEKLRKW